MKYLVAYLISALLFFAIALIPTFFKVYDWPFAIMLTVVAILSDLVGDLIKKSMTKKDKPTSTPPVQ